MGKPSSILLSASLLFLIALFAWAAFFAPWLFVWLTYEDLPGEWAQFYAFLLAALWAFRLARLPKKRDSRMFYWILFAALLYVVLEEISWGQRLIGFASPELFQKYNIQGETNIHNFFTGPIGTPLKHALTILLSLAMFFYGLSEFYYTPVLARFSSLAEHLLKKKTAFFHLSGKCLSFIVRQIEQIGFEPPPLILAPWFVLAAFFELGLFSFNEAELAELFVALGLAFQVSLRLDEAILAKPSPKFSSHLFFSVLAVPALALLTSFFLLQLDYFAKPTQNRLNNGYVKFARRYARYGAHEISLSLYRRALRNGKKTSKVYFGIADALDDLGRYEESEQWLRKYATILQKKSKKYPQNPSLLFLLSEVYDRLVEDELSSTYHQKASELISALLKKNPSKASLYFLKAKLLLQEDRPAKAARMFEKAYRLKPGRLLYRKKYFYYKEFLE